MNGGFAIGCGTCTPGYFNVNTEDFSDDIDWLIGKHQIAIGGEYIRTGDNTRAGSSSTEATPSAARPPARPSPTSSPAR